MNAKKRLLLLFLCVCLNTQAQKLTRFVKDFPDFNEVVNKFYNEYQPNEIDSDLYFIAFARKPSGWYVVKEDYETKNKTEELFWDSLNKFLKLNLFEYKTKLNDTSKFAYHLSKINVLNYDNERMFRIHTFYGYKGFAREIINKLEPFQNELNDEDLYSLGRAYSSVSIENYGDEGFNSFFNKDSVDFYFQNAIKCFETIYKRNPLFNDVVGKIQTKYANEYLTAYLHFNLIGDTEKAKKYIVPNIYPIEIITNAKNYLKNCPLNAVLFTHDDNDTYPLWYIQELENFRKDVTVINYSLLQFDYYLQTFKLLKFKLNSEKYKMLDYISTDNQNSILLDSFFNKINSPNFDLKTRYLPSSYFINKETNAYTKNYIYRYQLAWLDIYISNIDLPICTTGEEEGESLFGKHFENLGIVYRLNTQINSRCNLKEMIFFLDNLDTTGYCDIKNYPFKPDTNEYIDMRFIELLYFSMIVALYQAKTEKETDIYDRLITKWQYFVKNLAVKPSAIRLEEYQSILNTN